MLQKALFNGPMDSDTSPEAFKDGMGRFRKDVRIFSSENGESESAEIPRGNSVVTFTLPSGTNTVIGAAEDKKTRNIYYFVYNTSSNHTILEYNSVTGVVAKVFQDSVNILGGLTNILNFKTTNLITGIDIVELDSDNHLLYWTDGYVSTSDPNVYNEPKKINIEKGKYFMAGNHTLGYKTPFDPEILFRIKQPSECGPTYIWAKGAHEIQVTSNILQTPFTDPGLGNPPGGDATVAFNVIEFDESNEFNIVTYQWTVGETFQYSIATTVFIENQVVTPGTCDLCLFVNGVAVKTLNVSLGVYPASGYFVVQDDSIVLTAGDLVKVVVNNVSISTAFNVQGSSFTAQKKKVNYLFKQYPVFKTQFVYDDNDVSSWSPWSPYVFPNVVHDTTTGNDIITQDDNINVIVDTGNSIVTKIRIAVKMLGERLVDNVLQNLEFSLIAELDKANLLIADNSTYSFPFLNDGNYTPIYINESIKLFDAIPLASQAQELIIDGRIVDGLITEGQDPVDIDMIMNLSYIDISTLPNWATAITPASFLKSGGIYKYGIVYSDHGGRIYNANIQRGKSTVLLPNGNYGTTLLVPFLTEVGYAAPHATPNKDMDYVPQVNMEIYNSPPSWATHYFIVRSKNEAMTKYFQFAAENIQYVDITGTVVAANVATDLYVYLNNITGTYLSENGESSLVYDFTPGDRIRFIANNTGAGPSYNAIGAFFDFNDTQIGSYDASNGIVHIKMNSDIPIASPMSAGTLFEIYTPARSVINDNEFMYEIGECYPLADDAHGNLAHTFSTSNQLINAYSSAATVGTNTTIQLATGHGIVLNDKVKLVGTGYSVYGIVTTANATNVIVSTVGHTVTGTINTGIGTVYKAATGTLKSGDCFRIYQNMPWEAASVLYRLYSYVENMNISNLWVSNAWDYARPNKVDDAAKRITKPSTVIWSESFIPETFINGLSTVYDTNFQPYEAKYGGIYYLYNEDLWLNIFQELKVGGVPIQQTIFNGTQGEQILGQSTEVLPRIPKYYKGEYGIGKYPESFAVYGSAKYFIDVNRGAVLRLSNDGITNISKVYKMHNYFTDKCAAVLVFDGKVNVYGVFDVKFGEYIVSFQNIVDARGEFHGETLAFNEDKNAWSTFYSYLPDYLCSKGLDIVSFKDGALYKHNTNAVYANYYGVQYKPLLWFYCNVAPSNVKVFEAISLESLDAWAMTLETPISDENPIGQTTALLDTNFDLKEGIWYSDILKDDNTPNIVAFPVLLPNARFEGDVMRGVYALVKLEYQGTVYSKIFAANILVIPSERSNK